MTLYSQTKWWGFFRLPASVGMLPHLGLEKTSWYHNLRDPNIFKNIRGILKYIFLPSQTIDAIGLHPYKMHTNVPHHLVLKGFFWQSHSLCNFSSYGQSYVIGSNIVIYWIPTVPLASIHYLGTREPITYFPTKFKTSYLECTLISDILYKVCTFCICHYFW